MTSRDTAGEGQASLIPSPGGRRFGYGPGDQDPDLGKDTRFKSGQSGNPAGGKRGKSLSTQIKEILDDPLFIERINEKLPDDKKADPMFQGTPSKAMITALVLITLNPRSKDADRNKAFDTLAKYGYGTKVDITSDGERVQVAPIVISTITPRDDAAVEDGGDAETQTEAS